MLSETDFTRLLAIFALKNWLMCTEIKHANLVEVVKQVLKKAL